MTVIFEQIKGEISDYMHVAILLNKTSDGSCFSKLSTFVCFVTKCGKFCENFINFNDVSNYRSAALIADLSIRQLRELNYLKKLDV